MSMRIFRDSIHPQLIPVAGTEGVLGYINGALSQWPSSQFARFGKARVQVARIDTIGDAWQAAAILDVERFDATPEVAADWIPRRNDFRGDATVYIGRMSLGQLFACTGGLKYWIIVADWTGAPHQLDLPLPAGIRVAGVQYASGKQWDSTAMYADDWHAAPARAS
jgi:hypothetical protein